VRRPRGAVPRSVVAVSIALIVAACGGEAGPPPRGPEREPARVDESLGVVRIAPGATLDLGVVLDSDDVGLAAEVREALRVAVEDYGAVQGFRVALGTPLDAGCSGPGGTDAAEGLLAGDGAERVVAVLGPLCDASLRGLQGPLSAAGLVIIAPRPSDPDLTQNPFATPGVDRVDGVWRTAPNLLSQAAGAASFAGGELGLTRAGIVLELGTTSAGLAETFRAAFEDAGGTVVASLRLGDTTEAAELLDTLADARPEVVFLAVGPERLLELIEPWDERPRLRDTVRITTDRAVIPSFLGAPGSEDHYVVTPWLDVEDSSSSVTGMTASQVIERIRAVLGTGGTSGWWAHTYDAVTLLLRAIDDVAVIDADGSLVISRAELRTALASSEFRGMSGALACDALGDCASRRMVVRLHDDTAATGLAGLEVVHDTGP
jgi:branched-chain amino acid transport system substrate-binding protein